MELNTLYSTIIFTLSHHPRTHPAQYRTCSGISYVLRYPFVSSLEGSSLGIDVSYYVHLYSRPWSRESMQSEYAIYIGVYQAAPVHHFIPQTANIKTTEPKRSMLMVAVTPRLFGRNMKPKWDKFRDPTRRLTTNIETLYKNRGRESKATGPVT